MKHSEEKPKEPPKEHEETNPGFFRKHAIVSNLVIIILIAVLGLWIAYLSLQLFTNHGESAEVPSVENMSYTKAIEILHDADFRVDIRDSVYNDEIKPGYVIEQFPKAGSIVKPGRKIFLYINAVHPRQVIIDSENMVGVDALKGYSYRQAIALLEELGFKNIKTQWITGESDRVISVNVNGKPIKKLQKVPVNAQLTVKVYDGKLSDYRDSIMSVEYLDAYNSQEDEDEYDNTENYFDDKEDFNDDLKEESETDTE